MRSSDDSSDLITISRTIHQRVSGCTSDAISADNQKAFFVIML